MRSQNERDAVVSAPEGHGAPTDGALTEACIRGVQAVVAPPDGASVTVHRESARVALRPDGFVLVEVPYTLARGSVKIDGSYVAVSRANMTGVDAVFLSDRDRLTAEEWASYASAERPGNLP